MKLLKLALERQDYNLAAHVLVYGLVKAQIAKKSHQGDCGKGKKTSHGANRGVRR